MPQVVVAVFGGHANSIVNSFGAGEMPLPTAVPFYSGAHGAFVAAIALQFAR